jgi:hypothetical protein
MGGKAFNFLPATVFPRIPPPVYRALKARLLPRIQLLYSFAAVPFEAPQKSDHGDLDFVVACPKVKEDSVIVNVPHEEVRRTIGAKYFIPMDGNRTSNFAIPVKKGEWSAVGHGKEEDESRRVAQEDEEIYYQVCSQKTRA